jgi:pilus assembly protein CpaF
MLRRLETMVLLCGVEIPILAIREQIASAIDVIVHTGRIAGGKRAVTSITEITGMNESQILLQELFRWSKGNAGNDGVGGLVATGIPSRFRRGEGDAWD